MKALIYKRTHTGDPDEIGVFGIHTCMKDIRSRRYDAVIGIGGKTAPTDIRYKINWIGKGDKRKPSPEHGGDLVAFEHFALYEGEGIDIQKNFPNLSKHMYDVNRRSVMSDNLPKEVLEEVMAILDLVKDSPASKAYHTIENDNFLETIRNCNNTNATGSDCGCKK